MSLANRLSIVSFATLNCSIFTTLTYRNNLFLVILFVICASNFYVNLLSICFTPFRILFSFQGTFGGLKWARTTDLALIRRAL